VQSPIKSDRTQIADRLHSAAIHLLRYARRQDALSRQGPARLSALSVLVFGGPMTLGQLAAAEQVKPPTMSRIVAGLKSSGLARIEGDVKDARRIRVSVTPKGERLLQEARQRRIELLAETLGDVTPAELIVLREAAEIIERALRSAASRK
jgi:DNA-binding MarR family transcriptional regulator